MVEAFLASNHYSMLGSHNCSVYSLRIGLHRPVDAPGWNSCSPHGYSSDLWELVSGNKI